MLISAYGLTSIPDKHIHLLTRLYGIELFFYVSEVFQQGRVFHVYL